MNDTDQFEPLSEAILARFQVLCAYSLELLQSNTLHTKLNSGLLPDNAMLIKNQFS